ncbi:GMC family oxidoreductase [Kineococcus glutinatus]|uniref:GMC family oxidoreductase n=1 Tax=Kineococcus glutinatus TaxID=1070872 RepID=A0ABP9HSY5_9ACTN
MPEFTDVHRAALRALADTYVAAVPAPGGEDPDGFWARRGSDLGVPEALELILPATVPEPGLTGLLQLLEALAGAGLADQPQPAREALLRAVAGSAPEAGAGLDALRQAVLALAYGAPDPATGTNPSWRTWGYPGPPPAPQEPLDGFTPIVPLVPAGDTVLEADVVVVGSGSGGGVVAGELACAGVDVVVLERGGNFDRPDFTQHELQANQDLYLRGGYFPTADGNVTLVAGSTLGGGSTVNWSNSVRPRADVRRRWAREFGLGGLDGPEFDEDVDAVLAKISASTACSDLNDPHRRLAEGADRLGWHVRTAALNLRPDRYSPEVAGFAGFGDRSGAKQGTLETWLREAAGAGARILVRTDAERVLVEDGRAVGVLARYTDPATGASASVTVRAEHVVVACGALETPALLLRSGIGGPAVGRGLRLHPATGAGGVYAQPQRTWWGPPQSLIVDEFADRDDGFGFLVEGIHHGFAMLAASARWHDARQHKELVSRLGRTCWFVGIVQDRGCGSVTVGADGQAVHGYPFDDELDRRHLADALEAVVRLHEAAGAEEVHVLCQELRPWRRGEDLEAFVAAARAVPVGAGGIGAFSAHQMGGACAGTDPATSVAGPTGELHDTAGVWIGDTSAFPTSSGVNPMVSCMALARRTSRSLLAALGRGSRRTVQLPAGVPVAAGSGHRAR